MTEPTVTLGLLWHSMNSDNLGVGALTVSHLAILDAAAKAAGVTPRYVVVCWADPRPYYFTRPDMEIVQIRTKDIVRPGGLWSVFRRCDAVLDISGGDSFADIYGAGRIIRMLAGQNMVRFAGKPLIFSPQTIGPFERRWTRRLALNLMRRAKLVAVRDGLSTQFIRDVGFTGEILEASDVAFRLPFDAAPRADDGKIRVGLNVSGLLLSGGYTRDNMFGLKADYPVLVDGMLDYFTGLDDCEVHLVPHVISDEQEVEDDFRASQKLAERYPSAIVAPWFKTPSEAKSYISGMDYFVGARMHACIAALSSGVPVMPTAYSRKFKGVFGSIGYDHGADCKTEDEATILQKVKDGYAARAELKTDATTAYAESLRRLGGYDAWLKAFLAALPAGSAST